MNRFRSRLLVFLLYAALGLALTADAALAVDLSNPYAEQKAPERDTVNVVFNLNYEGAEHTAPLKVAKGGMVSESDAPKATWDEEHTFSGWYTDRACTQLFDFSTPLQGDQVLFARWRSDLVTVSFNFNYVGGPEILRNTVVNGEVANAPKEPERANYAFEGWYEDTAGTGEPFDFTAPVTGNRTLYAHWRLTDAEVVFDLAAKDAEPIDPVTVKVGEAIPRPADPIREAWNFDGWVDGSGNAYAFGTPVTVDDAEGGVITLTATWKEKTFAVTFDWGDYAEGAPDSVEVAWGQTVQEPANTRSGYTLVWQKEGEDYSFSSAVTAPLTLTAVWSQEESGDGNLTVSFLYNYQDAPSGGVYEIASVRPRRRVTMPEQPSREGYYFTGWYLDAEGTEKFNFSQYIRENTTIYAKWLKQYTFEAEYVSFTGLAGAGYSNEVRELQMIKKDVTGTCQASNGYYVTSMYVKGAHLTFHIHSDAETDGAVILLRLQAEYVDMTINPETYVVSVNGTPLAYDELTISDPAHSGDIQTNARRPFFNYALAETAHLNAGDNEITLLVNNTVDFDAMGMHFGTLSSYAPMVDCIYVCADTALTWEPITANIAEWEAAQSN